MGLHAMFTFRSFAGLSAESIGVQVCLRCFFCLAAGSELGYETLWFGVFAARTLISRTTAADKALPRHGDLCEWCEVRLQRHAGVPWHESKPRGVETEGLPPCHHIPTGNVQKLQPRCRTEGGVADPASFVQMQDLANTTVAAARHESGVLGLY